MSHTSTYSIASDFGPDGFHAAKFTKELYGLSLACTVEDWTHVYDVVEVITDIQPSPGDQTSIDDVVANHLQWDLNEYKTKRGSEIDARTRQLIGAGFVHSSKTFSLTLASQSKLNGAHAQKASMTYPVVWNSIDDLDTISLADEAAFDSFYDDAFDKVREHLDSGTTLKDSVRAAADRAAVDAVTDTR